MSGWAEGAFEGVAAGCPNADRGSIGRCAHSPAILGRVGARALPGSPLTLLLLALIGLLAFTVEATAGFGATIVTVTLAAYFMPIDAVLAALLPANVVLSGYLALRYRRSIDVRILVRRVGAWMVPGMAIGMLPSLVPQLGALREQGFIKGLFAGFVVVLAVVELWRARRASPDDTRPLPGPLAALSLVGAGVVHGLFACGGPMLVYVVGRELTDKARFRATLSAVWLTLNLVLIAEYVAEGAIDGTSLRASGVMFVSLVAGLALGEWIHRRLSVERFRLAVFTLLLFAGSALLVRAWFER
jgi:uncharacterized membrane protein YfcA